MAKAAIITSMALLSMMLSTIMRTFTRISSSLSPMVRMLGALSITVCIR